MIGVVTSYPSALILSISNSSKISPFFIVSPDFFFGVKYFPFKFTVSIPTCTKSSTPSSLTNPNACPVSKTASTFPSNGA